MRPKHPARLRADRLTALLTARTAFALAALLGTLPAFGGAASLSDARDNIETVILTFVSLKSPAGHWPVKRPGGGPPARMKLEAVDPATIQRSAGEVFKAAAEFTEARSGKRYFAEFEVDFGGTDWRVTRTRWITRAQKEELAKQSADVSRQESALAAASAARRSATAAKRAALPPGTSALPGLSLPALGSLEPVALDSCPTRKCLTVYLTPWCPHCRKATANIVSLKKFLKENGIATRIVIGDDSAQEVGQYAQSLGQGTLMDPDKEFKFSGGVPHLFVSEDGGRIVKEMAGFYEEPAPPAELAEALGLP